MNTKGLDLWKKSLQIIPGGNGLLSKRPERYAPDIWPTYFKSSKGVEVTDIDDNLYIDMAQMGIGSAILGYANEELNEAVIRSINLGVNCTLNSFEEYELASKLIELNPFAGAVRFAKTGGEAMSIAVRIARAASNKSKVLFSGYHGWSDWYLSANIKNAKNLNNHLLDGLKTNGVPKGLINTSIPFNYDDLDDFEEKINQHKDIGVICIEGARGKMPSTKFLEKINQYAREKDIIIICDEITSGWRLTDGGVYKLNNLKPDIVVYAKAMGGGFPISAVIGTKEVMDKSQDTFISSTMFTERTGFVAALKTIEILKRVKGWEHLNKIGTIIGKGWLESAEKYNLKLNVSELKPLISFKLNYENLNNHLITYFTQEMLKFGYLASSSVYVSLAHSESIIEEYLDKVDLVFKKIAIAIEKNNIKECLNTRVRSDSFQRLTK